MGSLNVALHLITVSFKNIMLYIYINYHHLKSSCSEDPFEIHMLGIILCAIYFSRHSRYASKICNMNS